MHAWVSMPCRNVPTEPIELGVDEEIIPILDLCRLLPPVRHAVPWSVAIRLKKVDRPIRVVQTWANPVWAEGSGGK